MCLPVCYFSNPNRKQRFVSILWLDLRPLCVTMEDAKQPVQVTILAVQDAVRAAHDAKHIQADHAHVLYGDGTLTSQKGGDLMWSRTEFTHRAAIANKPFLAMPAGSTASAHGGHAIVQEEDGLRLRQLMKALYGLAGVREVTDVERMLGLSVEDIANSITPKQVEERLGLESD